jgi:GNAT superfamily N-acetyltransferase
MPGAAEAGRSEQVAVYPVTPDRWQDLAALFATAADPSQCWCLYWRCSSSEYHRTTRDARRQRLKDCVDTGRVPGLLAYLDGQAIGWCSLSPREAFPRLQRSPTLRPVDDVAVWSVVCFFVHRKYRRQGIATALLTEAVAWARRHGVVALEGYPIVPTHATLPSSAAFPGTVVLFERVGFTEVARRSPARAILRYELHPENQLPP